MLQQVTGAELLLMQRLGITGEEARELAKFDKGELELEEVEELTKKAKQVEAPVKRGRKPKQQGEGVDGITQQKRERKENPTKQKIIEILRKSLVEELGISEELVQVTNKEKTILVQAFGETFEVDLKQKRKPKK